MAARTPIATAPSGSCAVAARRRPTLVLGVLLLGFAVAVAALAVGRADAAARDARRAEAIGLAREVATTLASLDSTDLPRQTDLLADRSTGAFRKQLLGSGAVLRSLAGSARFTARGEVTSVGLEGDDEQRATVLVTTTARVTNTALPQEATRVYAQVIVLERAGDRWLVNGVTPR